jgi:glycosyltransferase involved in cell wall biosynthesis
MTARVSVIVPTFNRSALLREALASVLAQRQPEMAVLVADNASDDDTPNVVRSFDDSRLSYLRRETNIGWLDNFNRSLAGVSTEYVSVLGDDDRMLPGAMVRAVDALDRAPSAAFCHSSFDQIDARGATVLAATSWSGLTADTLELGQVFIDRAMHVMARVCSPTVVFRTSALPEPAFDARDGSLADFTLWLRLALDGDVQYLATPGVEYRDDNVKVSSFGESVGTGGWVFDPDVTRALEAAKLRFVDEHAASMVSPGRLRHAAAACARTELLVSASHAADRGRADGVRALASTVRTHPRAALTTAAAKVLAKAVLGPRLLAWRSERGGVPGIHV